MPGGHVSTPQKHQSVGLHTAWWPDNGHSQDCSAAARLAVPPANLPLPLAPRPPLVQRQRARCWGFAGVFRTPMSHAPCTASFRCKGQSQTNFASAVCGPPSSSPRAARLGNCAGLTWQKPLAIEQWHPVSSSLTMRKGFCAPPHTHPSTCQVSGGDAAPASPKSASGSRPASPVASSASSSSSSNRGSAPEPGACCGCHTYLGFWWGFPYICRCQQCSLQRSAHAALRWVVADSNSASCRHAAAPAGWRQSRQTAPAPAGPPSAAPPAPAPGDTGHHKC